MDDDQTVNVTVKFWFSKLEFSIYRTTFILLNDLKALHMDQVFLPVWPHFVQNEKKKIVPYTLKIAAMEISSQTRLKIEQNYSILLHFYTYVCVLRLVFNIIFIS